MNSAVYLDNAATTKMRDEVFEAIQPYFQLSYGNPSSIHSIGRETKKAVDLSRHQVASALGAETSEIFFTSGGTESDNWVIKGIMNKPENFEKKLVTTSIEHHAILHSAKTLEEKGIKVVYLEPDQDGLIDPQKLKNAMCEDTALVSIMYANNEIGTIQPISVLADIAHEHNALFHTDAVQAVGSIAVNVKSLNVDFLSLSAHKFYGPKGIGALFVKKGIFIEGYIDGGAQERGKRAGTENVPGIVGLGKAIELAASEQEESEKRIRELRDLMIADIRQTIPGARINGSLTSRLPGNVNITIDDVDTNALLIRLDMEGICASGGSACTAGSVDPSHVLLAIGLTEKQANSSVRFSIGKFNTREEIEFTVKKLKTIVENLR